MVLFKGSMGIMGLKVAKIPGILWFWGFGVLGFNRDYNGTVQGIVLGLFVFIWLSYYCVSRELNVL